MKKEKTVWVALHEKERTVKGVFLFEDEGWNFLENLCATTRYTIYEFTMNEAIMYE